MNRRFIQRGGLWVIGQFALILAIAILGIACRGASRSLPFLACGFVLLTVSAICGIGGLANLGRNLTPFPKPSPQSQLVQHGIYGWIRHPLYMAVICATAGWSLIWQSWPALVVSLALAMFLDAKARHEERWLRQQFPDYARYSKRVRRFIPRIY